MYKYYKQLDNPNNQILKLYDNDKYASIYIKRNVDNNILYKYHNLLSELNKIKNLYLLITPDLIKKNITDDELQWNLINRFESLKEDGDLYSIENNYIKDELSYDELKSQLLTMKMIIYIVKYVFPHNKYYIEILKDLNDLLNQISNKDIIYERRNYELKLPDAWYITREGYLYNTMGPDGHKQANLVYPFEEIQCEFGNYNDAILEYRNKLNEIISNGYVRDGQFKFFLNYINRPKQLEKGRIYDRMTNILIIGIVAAHIDLYEAFNKLHALDNPRNEYFKMLKLTNFSMDDMFVKFLGMSKLGVSGTKTICTSNPNEKLFEEYTKRGFNIDLVNPIEVVNNHIEEIDLNTHKTLKKVLDKSFKSAIKEL